MCFVSRAHWNRVDKGVTRSLPIYFTHHLTDLLIYINTEINLFNTAVVPEIMSNLQKLTYCQGLNASIYGKFALSSKHVLQKCHQKF